MTSNISSSNYYECLGLTSAATAEEITKAYRRLALQHHPDKNIGDPNAEENFKKLATAYGCLNNAKTRKEYDALLSGKSTTFFSAFFNKSKSYDENCSLDEAMKMFSAAFKDLIAKMLENPLPLQERDPWALIGGVAVAGVMTLLNQPEAAFTTAMVGYSQFTTGNALGRLADNSEAAMQVYESWNLIKNSSRRAQANGPQQSQKQICSDKGSTERGNKSTLEEEIKRERLTRAQEKEWRKDKEANELRMREKERDRKWNQETRERREFERKIRKEQQKDCNSKSSWWW